MWTPLLIKAPHQHEPQVIDTPTASIDVLPTIIDLLDVNVDWDLDGQAGYSTVIQSRALDYGPEWDLRFWRYGRLGDLVGLR